jgi:hypothetical protein
MGGGSGSETPSLQYMRGFRCHLYLVPLHLESIAPLAIPLLLYGLKKEGEFMLHIPVMSSARNDPLQEKSMIWSRICNPVGRMYGSAHPDPKQNVTDPEHCFLAIEKWVHQNERKNFHFILTSFNASYVIIWRCELIWLMWIGIWNFFFKQYVTLFKQICWAFLQIRILRLSHLNIPFLSSRVCS